MAVIFDAKTLRGDTVTPGVEVADGRIPFVPRWGMVRHSAALIAATTASDGMISRARVAMTSEGPLLVANDGKATKELVLVQEYLPGSGGKRWPKFAVQWQDETVLSRVRTMCGSGWEKWTLVTAPLGWAENIATQFVNERDYPDQTISYTPGACGLDASELPHELLIAFGGDEQTVREFIAAVETLPMNQLDEHIIRQCGRNRVKRHLEMVSGDPEFFRGADPNRVVGYIDEVYSSQDKRHNEVVACPEESMLGTMADALQDLGL